MKVKDQNKWGGGREGRKSKHAQKKQIMQGVEENSQETIINIL